jgi:protease I
MDNVQNQRIAILVAKGFEQVELTEPKRALEKAGAVTDIVSPEPGKVKAWNFENWGEEFTVDMPLERARAQDYHALLLPGGVMNPDKLRRNEHALNFVRDFFAAGKPVASICHGPWTLIDAGVVRGRKLTSYPSIQMDLKNAGAYWVDEEVVVDAGLVTSRKPSDIPVFNEKMIEEFGEGMHGGQKAKFEEHIHVP